ncbi:phage tail assembly chaperone [Pseudomonas chlororaphis]|uniref:phage tail assembly chaperone n=1 Tax=Pseudomonas chlororaphis TaxID=587753 RepID=UPI001F14E06B|nr:phage tail assembly chaperone [Pseudomonas chlororaphis]
MSMLYSQTTGCLYILGRHSPIPDDAVEISEETILAVIGNPTPGKIRGHDEKGVPYLKDPPPATPEQLAADERKWRDLEVFGSDALVARHRDEVEQGSGTTLTESQYKELQGYRQLLRDWPEHEAFPDSDKRPAAPAWLAGQL